MEIIRLRTSEMALPVLTCDAYNSIRENRPNLVVANYKQASKLQELLAKHHCPKFKEQITKNVGDEKKPVTILLEGAPNFPWKTGSGPRESSSK